MHAADGTPVNARVLMPGTVRVEWMAVRGAIAYRLEYWELTDPDVKYAPRGEAIVEASFLRHDISECPPGVHVLVRVGALLEGGVDGPTSRPIAVRIPGHRRSDSGRRSRRHPAEHAPRSREDEDTAAAARTVVAALLEAETLRVSRLAAAEQLQPQPRSPRQQAAHMDAPGSPSSLSESASWVTSSAARAAHDTAINRARWQIPERAWRRAPEWEREMQLARRLDQPWASPRHRHVGGGDRTDGAAMTPSDANATVASRSVALASRDAAATVTTPTPSATGTITSKHSKRSGHS